MRYKNENIMKSMKNKSEIKSVKTSEILSHGVLDSVDKFSSSTSTDSKIYT